METLQVGFENKILLVRFPRVFPYGKNSRFGGSFYNCSQNAAETLAALCELGFVARVWLATV
ncbi:hypothetical protein, partial [Treponema zioleckii]|uniref:hypothetical protein n=1 Tax=Treponema zioleckii TaxID=331680 RepID=UPI001A93A6A0